ncbi:MAG: hypothetical protein BRD57_00780 [Proteobacteria bacterium SW_6_67_9]|nr:MAG: hypothetical protein BRD57_00780 [Proteobacteria bacterium SW_6_67_9]
MSGDLPRLFARIAREIDHLEAVRDRLLEGCDAVEPAWIRANADDPLFVDRLNSFGMQLGRTGESITKKLLPALLAYANEPVGSVIDNLNTAHKVGWIDDPVQWTDLNSIRNTLVHEYLEDPAFMAQQIEAAVPLVDRIAQDFQRLRAWAERYIDLRNEAGPRR